MTVVEALENLSIKDREVVLDHVRALLLDAMTETEYSEDELVSIVSRRAQRYRGEVRFALSTMDVTYDAQGRLSPAPDRTQSA